MSDETKVPAIPAVTSSNLNEVARAIKSILDVREGRLGDPLDANVTFRDLVDAGAVFVRPGWNGRTGTPVIPPWAEPDGYDPTADLSPPPRPEGVQVTGLFATVMIQFDEPRYRNHAYAEVWRSSSNTIGSAVRIGTTDTRFYTDSLGTGTSNYYWVRFVSVADVVGPYNATDGLLGQTATNPALVLASLTGQITESQLFGDLATRISLIDAPASTPGSVNARLAVVQSQVNDLLNTPAYNNSTTYQANALVTYNGAIYQAKQQTTGNLPTNATYWTKIGDYSSLGEAVAAQATQISTLTTNLSAETSARTTLATAVNDPTTGLAATRSTLLSDYYTKSAADSAISSAITTLSSTVNSTLTGYVTNASLTTNHYTKTQTDSAISSAVSTLVSTTALNNALSSYTNTATLTQNYYTKTQTDSAISSATSSLVSTTALTNALGSYATNANLTTNYYTKTATDSAISNATSTLVSTTALNNALSNYTTTATLQQNYYTKTQADSAISSATSTLVSTAALNTALGNYTTTASLQTNYYTKASAQGLEAQYTVKTDLNGYVSGFGLASTSVGSTPTSSFIIRADSFSIANPTGPSVAPAMPFIVRTTATTINGVNVPVGVYIADAFIQNGTISNAKIGNAAVDNAKIANLDAGKINTGFLSADRIQAGTIDAKILAVDSAKVTGLLTANQINGANLVIRSGAYTGYNWPASGGGFYIGPSGVLFGRYDANNPASTYFQFDTATGAIYANSFSIVNGNATFSGSLGAASGTFTGALSAATGTFSGSLTAQAVSAVDTINIAGNAVTVAQAASITSNSGLNLTVPVTTSTATGGYAGYTGSNTIPINSTALSVTLTNLSGGAIYATASLYVQVTSSGPFSGSGGILLRLLVDGIAARDIWLDASYSQTITHVIPPFTVLRSTTSSQSPVISWQIVSARATIVMSSQNATHNVQVSAVFLPAADTNSGTSLYCFGFKR